MLTALLSVLVILLAFPIGYLLARATREELVQGRKSFLRLYLICIPLAIILAFLPIKELKLPVILSLIFIAIVSFMSFWLSYDKKFVRK
jgi:hypothetical protein